MLARLEEQQGSLPLWPGQSESGRNEVSEAKALRAPEGLCSGVVGRAKSRRGLDGKSWGVGKGIREGFKEDVAFYNLPCPS